MVPLSLFRSRTFTGANLLTLGVYGALAVTFFFLPMNLIQVQGYSATGAGAATLPAVLILFLLSRWSGGLTARLGARLPLMIGPLVAAVGLALMALPGVGGRYWLTFFPAVVVLGLGMALTVAPLTTTVMNAVPVSRAGIASGINNAVSRTAGLIAVAVMSVLVVRVFDRELQRRLSEIGPSREMVLQVEAQREMLASAEAPRSANGAERARIRQAVQASFVTGFRWLALSCAGLALASTGAAALLIDRGPQRGGRRLEPAGDPDRSLHGGDR